MESLSLSNEKENDLSKKIQLIKHEQKKQGEKSDQKDTTKDLDVILFSYDQDFEYCSPEDFGKHCFGFNKVKELMNTQILLPMKFPHLFENFRFPKSWLLHGPPGAGKTFFCSSFVKEIHYHLNQDTSSKEQNDKTEQVQSTFEAKCRFLRISFSDRYHYSDIEIFFTLAKSPSKNCEYCVAVIDDIDCLRLFDDKMTNALIQHMKELQDSNERVFRAKKEFDETTTKGSDKMKQQNILTPPLVFVIGLTNRPWELNPILRRQFIMRLLTPILDFNSRHAMVLSHFKGDDLKYRKTMYSKIISYGKEQERGTDELKDEDYNPENLEIFKEFAKRLENCTCADISSATRDVVMRPISRLYDLYTLEELNKILEEDKEDYLLSKVCLEIDDFLGLPVVPSIPPAEMKQFEEWNSEFGVPEDLEKSN